VRAVAAIAGGLALALAAQAATRSEKPPTATGPISLRSHDCHRFPSGGGVCAYVYVLDRAATTDAKGSWTVYWVNQTVAATASAVTCTTAFAEGFTWGTGGRAGPRAAAVYPAAGAPRAVAPGSMAHLVVSAAGKARVAGDLRQRTFWPAGLLATTASPGQLLVLWQGRTTGVVPVTSAAEVRNPGDEFGGGVSAHYEVQAPCRRVPAPGPGYLARVVAAPGHTAWLQVRIPGFHAVLDRRSSLVSWAGYGKAIYALTSNGVPAGAAAAPVEVAGRAAVMLSLPPGHYVAQVTLRGAGATRRYRLPFRIS